MSKSVLPRFSSSYFMISSLTFRSLIHFEFIFVYAVVVFAQWLSPVQRFGTRWLAACQVPLSFIVSQSLLKFMPIESVMPSNHLILCDPLLLLASIFPSIRVFSNESILCIK